LTVKKLSHILSGEIGICKNHTGNGVTNEKLDKSGAFSILDVGVLGGLGVMVAAF